MENSNRFLIKSGRLLNLVFLIVVYLKVSLINNSIMARPLWFVNLLKKTFPNIKIIIINGKKDQRFLAKAIASGANDVYRQPCNVPLLVEKVHAFLFLQDKLKV